MNAEHQQVCASDEWRETIQTVVLPAVLGDHDLGDDLLEIGPGYGATTDYLRTKVAQLTAVEIDPELATDLQAKLAGTNATVVRGDATQLEFEDDSFSGATSFFMLHHVPSAELQDRVFREVERVLRPGGLFVVADSIGTDDLAAFHHDDIYVPVDPSGLAARLRAAGFVDVDVIVVEDQGGWSATARASRAA